MTITLLNIKEKVRKITGRPSVNQLSDSELQKYINDFLTLEFSEQLRLFELRRSYEIILSPNVGVYTTLPSNANIYPSFEPPAYVDGYEVQYFQDERAFFQQFSQLKYSVQINTGSGIAGPYTGQYNYTPIQPSTIIISTIDVLGNLMTCRDNGTGTFSGNVVAGSAVNYQTGAVTNLTWTAAVGVGQPIYMSATQYIRGRPLAVLYYANTFFFWPWPDKAYQFLIVAYQDPVQLLLDTESPLLNQWWELISYGAALKIFSDNLDMESYSKIRPIFDEQRNLVERKTLKQLSNQRAATIYGDAQTWPWQGGYPYL